MKKPFLEESGLSLLELLISASLSIAVSVGAVLFFQQSYSAFNYLRYSIQMNAIARSVMNQISREDVLIASATYAPYLSQMGNKALAACMPHIGERRRRSCLAQFTQATGQVEFNVILPLKPGIAPTAQRVMRNIIAGPDTVYHLSGGVCSPGSQEADCQFSVKAYFWATCPADSRGVETYAEQRSAAPASPQGGCDKAASIHVRYQVTHSFVKGLTMGLEHQLASIPEDKVFWLDKAKTEMSTLMAKSFDVSALAELNFSLTCPLNETIVGIQEGAVHCQCLYPFNKVKDIEGNEICSVENAMCLPGQIYAGTYRAADGKWRSLCKRLDCDFAHPVPLEVGCPKGEFIGRLRKFDFQDYQSELQVRENGCTTNGQTCKYDPENLTCEIPVDCPLTAVCCKVVNVRGG